MVIAKDVPIHRLVLEMIDCNRERGADRNYLDFLIRVYGVCCLYRDFAECLELGLKFSTGEFPSIRDVERALARKDGSIRHLLEYKGIIEPRLEGTES